MLTGRLYTCNGYHRTANACSSYDQDLDYEHNQVLSEGLCSSPRGQNQYDNRSKPIKWEGVPIAPCHRPRNINPIKPPVVAPTNALQSLRKTPQHSRQLDASSHQPLQPQSLVLRGRKSQLPERILELLILLANIASRFVTVQDPVRCGTLYFLIYNQQLGLRHGDVTLGREGIQIIDVELESGHWRADCWVGFRWLV